MMLKYFLRFCSCLRSLALSAVLIAPTCPLLAAEASSPAAENGQTSLYKVPLVPGVILNDAKHPASPVVDIAMAPCREMTRMDVKQWAASVHCVMKMKDGSLLAADWQTMPIEVKDAEGNVVKGVAHLNRREDGSLDVSLDLEQIPQGERLTWESSLSLSCAAGKTALPPQTIDMSGKGSWEACGVTIRYFGHQDTTRDGKSFVGFRYDTAAPIASIDLFDSRNEKLLGFRMRKKDGLILGFDNTPSDGIVRAVVTRWDGLRNIVVPIKLTIGLNGGEAAKERP